MKELDKTLCPVCERYHFHEEDFFEICPVCGWEDDGIQRDEPDYAGGANDMSLNEYKKAWESGKPCH